MREKLWSARCRNFESGLVFFGRVDELMGYTVFRGSPAHRCRDGGGGGHRDTATHN